MIEMSLSTTVLNRLNLHQKLQKMSMIRVNLKNARLKIGVLVNGHFLTVNQGQEHVTLKLDTGNQEHEHVTVKQDTGNQEHR